jgi:hypothetical protein
MELMKLNSLKVFLIFVTLAINLCLAPTTWAQNQPQLADRVLFAINNIPYTQLQLESYLNVKESLRDNAESSQVVNETNWTVALDAFVKDMMIHQEATKSSGFRPTKEAIQKLRARAEKTSANVPQFKAALTRLALTKTELETEILRIATVENYRRGKASITSPSKDGQSNWETDLQTRSIVRFFDGAKVWKNVNPGL